ncbi:DUF4446 family protein [Candidatus Daviesbacteria bacterium]|nr:DUF4446 family protein [Candidatus Daviesbacteria bacterium]
MYSDWISLVVVGFGTVWLGILTFLVLQQRNFLKSLFPKSGERDIRKKFEEVLQEVGDFKKDLADLTKVLESIKVEGSTHLQKVELLRFNPYQDTGGNISFTIAMLDNKGTGFILTSLHARSGTRIFAKSITAGKSKYELSKEEEEVLKRALNYD